MVVTVLVAVSGQLMKVRPGLMSACLMAQLTLQHSGRNPGPSITFATKSPEDEGGKVMICKFCKEDVKDSCHNRQEMQERASWHVERCERALKAHRNGLAGAPAKPLT
jgi:hypothetical protein